MQANWKEFYKGEYEGRISMHPFTHFMVDFEDKYRVVFDVTEWWNALEHIDCRIKSYKWNKKDNCFIINHLFRVHYYPVTDPAEFNLIRNKRTYLWNFTQKSGEITKRILVQKLYIDRYKNKKDRNE